jgi:hypothetical protein
MRWLLWIVVLTSGLWSGYWFVGSGAVETGARQAIAAQAAMGRTAQAEVSIKGFPNRFDLTLTEPRFGDPALGVVYEAPFVQIFALSYKPWHLIAAFAPEQRLVTPLGTFTLAAEKLQASLVAEPGADLPLDRLAVAGDGLALTAPDGTRTGAAAARLATRRDSSAPHAHEIGLDVTALAPDAARATLAGLPPTVETLRIVAVVALDAPLDRTAAMRPPRLERLTLRETSFRWGSTALAAEGEIAPDAQGRAEGTITIRVTDWRRMIDAAMALGLLRPEIAPTVAEMARLMSEAAGTGDNLDLPLRMTGGRMSLGPLPLGPAPQLR